MILNVAIHGVYRYAESWLEMAELIDEVMQKPHSERVSIDQFDSDGIVCFMFSERRHSPDIFDWWPDNYLYVSVNAVAGYGGLTWLATIEREQDETSEYIWVSDNPAPPEFDPRVVSDPGFPLFYDRRSVLPVGHVRAALEEFCRTGTGARPECIRWVHGEMNGQRLDV